MKEMNQVFELTHFERELFDINKDSLGYRESQTTILLAVIILDVPKIKAAKRRV